MDTLIFLLLLLGPSLLILFMLYDSSARKSVNSKFVEKSRKVVRVLSILLFVAMALTILYFLIKDNSLSSFPFFAQLGQMLPPSN